jgi:hypothetical protein
MMLLLLWQMKHRQQLAKLDALRCRADLALERTENSQAAVVHHYDRFYQCCLGVSQQTLVSQRTALSQAAATCC